MSYVCGNADASGENAEGIAENVDRVRENAPKVGENADGCPENADRLDSDAGECGAIWRRTGVDRAAVASFQAGVTALMAAPRYYVLMRGTDCLGECPNQAQVRTRGPHVHAV